MEKKKPGLDYGEFIVPAVMVATMAVFLYQSIDIEQPKENLRLVWIVLGVLSLAIALIVRSIFKDRQKENKKAALFKDLPTLKRQATLFALVVVYVAVLNHAGFIITSTLMFPLMFLASGVKKYRLILMVSLFLPFFTYVVFRRFFNILLPEGFLEDYLVNYVLYRKWF